jgi:hypothetical protein
MPIKRHLVLLTSAALLQGVLAVLPQGAFAADDSGVNAYRPTVSNPATLPLPGQLELEFGGLHVKTGGARDDSLPYLFKLAFSPQWGILVGGDAHLWSRDEAGNRVSGNGDTTVTAKRAFLIDDTTAFGIELGAKLPTARDTLGSGRTDFTLNGILSQDIGTVHMDANLGATRLGGPDSGTARMQTALSASFSLPLSSDWTGMTELSGVRHGGEASTAQLLAAVSYSPGKRYAIDVGVARGLNSASQDWSFFTGFVIPVAKLW